VREWQRLPSRRPGRAATERRPPGVAWRSRAVVGGEGGSRQWLMHKRTPDMHHGRRSYIASTLSQAQTPGFYLEENEWRTMKNILR
jgi:hypothetical protein